MPTTRPGEFHGEVRDRGFERAGVSGRACGGGRSRYGTEGGPDARRAAAEEEERYRLEPAGKGELFARLAPSLTGSEPSRSHREVALALGIWEEAVKTSSLRLRKRFGRLLREEIRQTVEGDEEVDDELRYLLSAVRG